MEQEVKWNDKFSIGVELVDNAHKKLFSIVRRILLLSEDEKKSQWACKEGIKYFKWYTIEHFRQEEEYMRSINYPALAAHKQIHDQMRERTLPALERNLVISNYSKESVEQFLGVCIGWLTGHIMVEDKAITGKIVSRQARKQAESINKKLKKSLVLAIKDVFCKDSRIFSDRYNGEYIGETTTCYLVYNAPDGGLVRILISLDKRLALSVAGMMLNANLKKTNQIMSTSIELILQEFLCIIADCFDVRRGSYQLIEHACVNASSMKTFIQKRAPKYSMLLETKSGYLAFCLEHVAKS